MNRIYYRFRFFLLGFALGLNGFWMFDGASNGLVEPFVDLPKAASENVLIVSPRYDCEFKFFHNPGGGGHGLPFSETELNKCISDVETRGATYKTFR